MPDDNVIEAEFEGQEEPGNELEKPAEKRVVRYSVTHAKIAELKEKYKEVPEDLSVKENYEFVKKATAHLRGLRGDVEKRRKELKADALAWGKLVDGTAKELINALTEIEEPLATAKKEHDTAIEIAKREAALAEEKRVDGIAERIAKIKALVEKNISSSSEAIQADIDGLEQDDLVDEWAMEFADKAKEAIQETLGKLKELHSMKYQQETFAAQQAEAEARRKEEEEKARIQREKEVEEERARLAAEREAMEKEKARLAEEQRIKDEAAAAAERERVAAFEAEKARLAEEQAERDRIQKEKDEAAAAELAKMKAEMEAMRKAQEAQEEKEKPVEPEVVQEVQEENTQADPPSSGQQDESISDYKAAGRAMMKFIGNREVTKVLLDAIINGDIPNVKFTGVI